MAHVLVAIAAPVATLFSYRADGELADRVQVGQLVEVPFGRGRRRGVIVERGGRPPEGVDAKPITRIVEVEPVVHPALMPSLRFASDYYLVPPGEMIFAALPPLMRRVGRAAAPKALAVASATEAARQVDLNTLTSRAPRQAALLERLLAEGSLEVRTLERDRPGARQALRGLEKKGLVDVGQQARRRRPAATDLPPPAPVQHLTTEQAAALERILPALDADRSETFLLHGVTGSGKTEVYLRAISHCLALGRSAILLVPEISLTPQLTQRVTAVLGEQVAVLHSGLGQGERLDEWRRLQAGQARVALGARSAVFAPVADLGLVVIDEEHDSSYKQSERLPYNGRDLALVRAQREGALALLGSATPSVESFARALDGRSTLVELTERVQARPMPEVESVDLRRVLDPLERAHVLSPALADALAQTLDAGEQAILFLNRRGYSSFALCRDCGQAIRCTNCSVALVHHLSEHRLRCHYCGLSLALPRPCPACDSRRVQLFGLGTQKCEQEVRRRFPGARVERLDSDSAGGRGVLASVLARFARGQADVLVGTQMVTKGHDIPGVTLVGVVLADLGLHLPDFRAAERTFQQILQVAGRAGRGERPGRVIVQSFLPGHEAIVLAAAHDYRTFVARELERRRALGYPPATRVMMIRLSHPAPDRVAGLAAELGAVARRHADDGVQLLGPVVSPLAQIRGRHRWQMLVKATRIEQLHRLARAVRAHLRPPSEGRILFDVDPVDML